MDSGLRHPVLAPCRPAHPLWLGRCERIARLPASRDVDPGGIGFVDRGTGAAGRQEPLVRDRDRHYGDRCLIFGHVTTNEIAALAESRAHCGNFCHGAGLRRGCVDAVPAGAAERERLAGRRVDRARRSPLRVRGASSTSSALRDHLVDASALAGRKFRPKLRR